jgi:trehalose 6-phosphate phosphatase
VLTVENESAPWLDLRRVALFMDVDGTLLDLAPTPDSVTVPKELVASIAKLEQKMAGAIAFVSGRKLATLDALFAPLKLAAVGCHGAEFRPSAGGTQESVPDLPDPVRRCAAEIAAIAPGVVVEDKGHTLAVHYRLAPESGAAVLRAIMERRDFLAGYNLAILRGKDVIEIKPRWFNKGTGLKRLMQVKAFAGRTPVFLGDDTTDEDVFRMLPDFGGIGYSVGRQMDGAADVFESPGAVRAWLARLADGR